MRGKMSAASSWFHKPRVQVDLLDLVFLDGCDNSLYVPIPRFCTAPFVLTKNLLWDTRILAHEWKTYGGVEVTIGVRLIHVIGFCILFIYYNWRWNYFGEWDEFQENDYATRHLRGGSTHFDKEFGIQHRGVGVGFPGERLRWEHFKSLKDFVGSIRTWW